MQKSGFIECLHFSCGGEPWSHWSWSCRCRLLCGGTSSVAVLFWPWAYFVDTASGWRCWWRCRLTCRCWVGGRCAAFRGSFGCASVVAGIGRYCGLDESCRVDLHRYPGFLWMMHWCHLVVPHAQFQCIADLCSAQLAHVSWAQFVDVMSFRCAHCLWW